ncbi:MAG TPA: sigma-70 family RNA polymerase sigma factor [Nocardioides sp.]|nr:sigma-70 family RNA polymerase sigma factor [Nocardioides sp.]
MVPVSLVPQPISPQAPSIAPSPAPSPAADGEDRIRRTDAIVERLRDEAPDSPARRALVDELVETNVGVARSIARRYRNRGIDLDDLEQVALLGLTKAAQRFDPTSGHDFLSYAVPTVRGELRRHFRDAGWMIRPPRRVQDLQSRISRAQHELEATLHRSPRPTEVAAHLGEELDAVVEALSADGCFTPTSLDLSVAEGASTLGDLIGAEDRAIESTEARIVLAPVVRQLSDRDRRIVHLRFYEERTQQEIAEAVSLTQAQVSRVLTRILTSLRAGLGEAHAAA